VTEEEAKSRHWKVQEHSKRPNKKYARTDLQVLKKAIERGGKRNTKGEKKRGTKKGNISQPAKRKSTKSKLKLVWAGSVS